MGLFKVTKQKYTFQVSDPTAHQSDPPVPGPRKPLAGYDPIVGATQAAVDTEQGGPLSSGPHILSDHCPARNRKPDPNLIKTHWVPQEELVQRRLLPGFGAGARF